MTEIKELERKILQNDIDQLNGILAFDSGRFLVWDEDTKRLKRVIGFVRNGSSIQINVEKWDE